MTDYTTLFETFRTDALAAASPENERRLLLQHLASDPAVRAFSVKDYARILEVIEIVENLPSVEKSPALGILFSQLKTAIQLAGCAFWLQTQLNVDLVDGALSDPLRLQQTLLSAQQGKKSSS